MKCNTVLLIVITILLLCVLWFTYTNNQQIQVLRQENAAMQVNIDSVLGMRYNKPQNETAASEPASKSSGNAFIDFLIQLEDGIDILTSGGTNQKIAVSSKYSLEDRYVSYKVKEPDFLGDQAGKVVLNISVNYLGDVKSAKLKSAQGITNEDVIEACKKAALKTQFNYDSDLGYNSRQAGTITYIFSEK